MNEASEEKRFPIMTTRKPGVAPHPMSVPWSVAEKAYSQYAKEYGHGQSLERLAERGGFGACEMDMLYPGWRDEVSELAALRTSLAAATQEVERLKAGIQSLLDSSALNKFPAVLTDGLKNNLATLLEGEGVKGG